MRTEATKKINEARHTLESLRKHFQENIFKLHDGKPDGYVGTTMEANEAMSIAYFMGALSIVMDSLYGLKGIAEEMAERCENATSGEEGGGDERKTD
jgi:hypothetical protein